jgi:hypothetical protein
MHDIQFCASGLTLREIRQPAQDYIYFMHHIRCDYLTKLVANLLAMQVL